MRYARIILVLAAVQAIACTGETRTPTDARSDDGTGARGDITAGRAAFANECAACHASRDGSDLAIFSFPDSTILRRATPHVDSLTARNIVAHIETLDTPKLPRGARPFQPGGIVLADDKAFAVTLFGEDTWPIDLTDEDLRVIDPLDVPVAIFLPRWSDEMTNLDWMPDQPLSEAILKFNRSAPEIALARYYKDPTLSNLVIVAEILVNAHKFPGIPGAPFPGNPDTPCGGHPPVDPETCFQNLRWTASLVAQHLLREGRTGRVHPSLHATWWWVGWPAFWGGIDNTEENAAAWLYLGWMYNYRTIGGSTYYTTNSLARHELHRHAVFVSLRTMIDQSGEERFQVYRNVGEAALFAPPHWAYSVARFGFLHVLDRLAAGEFPFPNDPWPADQINFAYDAVSGSVTAAELAELTTLRDRIIQALETGELD